ncbi:Creatinase/aminopeptidase [Cucurbitaria berberidis CBS 394.84]|uniref:Creatinase/aminopeptidase n=1 Tax=Cucurbitaria berberidis CBS 394.84 TaxID=1168544 RepID=A0A9P4GR05_9PLEO|nr:Creatinase/aminopeptidase [Cucurbitaria berberidis CBS 394.84]KAF1851118.1 Creatinase/aminopeptidase [Cucurbitaria berberidis CBS 394.84]
MKEPLLPYQSTRRLSQTRANLSARRSLCIFLCAVLFTWNLMSFQTYGSNILHTKKEHFRRCSINTYLATGLGFLETANRPTLEDYILRRNNLAKALLVEGVDAFVVEPGYTFSYYANVTQPGWEPWEPEERPFLMIIRPETLSDGKIVANTSFLVPHFEETRARLLNMPFEEDLHTVTYEEHWNYYTTLYLSEIWGDTLSPTVMVDEELRDFIQRGLASNGFTVTGLAGEAEVVRQVKSGREIGILKAVNTGTVEAIRAMRQCLYPYVTEKEVAEVLDDTMRAAGLEPFFNIVEFGKSAALPHGGYDGTRKLEPEMFVLIDVGAHLYGYSSDVCRTFFPPFTPNPPHNMTEQLDVWQLVLDAQTAAVKAMVPNGTAAAVDIAAREVIEAAGYGKYFTHRLGHSIGIKAHDSPYLNKANFGALLRPGMVFTAEPGVYVVDKFGVRHEDILVVREDGEAEIISGGFAKSPWDP